MGKIGEKIRKIRKEKGLTVEELAGKCSMSLSFISQLERNNANPSVGSLKKIATALGVPIVDFFESKINSSNNKVAEVVRKGKHKTLYQPQTQIKYNLLSPNLQGKIEFLLIVGPGKSSSGEDEFLHQGEEYGFVIEGIMDVYVDGIKFTLEEGDSIRFKSDKPHRWENPCEERFVAVWAVHPPSF